MDIFNKIRRFFVSDAKLKERPGITIDEDGNSPISMQPPSSSIVPAPLMPLEINSEDPLFKHPSATKNRQVSFATPLNSICEEEEVESYMEPLRGGFLHRSQSYEDLRQIYSFANGKVSRANSVN